MKTTIVFIIVLLKDRTQKSLGYFLQCNGESESSAWSCKASAELRMYNHKEDNYFTRNIDHIFCSKVNDWGYPIHMAWNDVIDPNRGFIKVNMNVL